MMDCFLIFPPVKSACRALRSHEKKSTGSEVDSRVNRFLEARMTACMNSWGDTCTQEGSRIQAGREQG
jgi:hypothetical protein